MVRHTVIRTRYFEDEFGLRSPRRYEKRLRTASVLIFRVGSFENMSRRAPGRPHQEPLSASAQFDLDRKKKMHKTKRDGAKQVALDSLEVSVVTEADLRKAAAAAAAGTLIVSLLSVLPAGFAKKIG
jgi:hypothetical protein